jgi:hypothetical protein
VFLFMKRMIKMVEDAKMSRDVLAKRLLEFCQNILIEHESPSSPAEFGFIQE